MNKVITTILIFLALIVGLVGGHSFWPKTVAGFSIPTTPTTNGTARLAQVVATSTTATTSWASLYNGDSQDRLITNIDQFTASTTVTDKFCTLMGATSAGLNQGSTTAATSTNSYDLAGNTNYVLFNGYATTSWGFFSSSTPGLTGTVGNRIWPAGTYLNFVSNGTTTSNCYVMYRVSYSNL